GLRHSKPVMRRARAHVPKHSSDGQFSQQGGEAWLAGWRRAVSWSARKIVGPAEGKTSLEQRAKVHNLLASVTMGEISSQPLRGKFSRVGHCWYWICHCRRGVVWCPIDRDPERESFPFRSSNLLPPAREGSFRERTASLPRHRSIMAPGREIDQVDTLSWFIFR